MRSIAFSLLLMFFQKWNARNNPKPPEPAHATLPRHPVVRDEDLDDYVPAKNEPVIALLMNNGSTVREVLSPEDMYAVIGGKVYRSVNDNWKLLPEVSGISYVKPPV